MTLTVGRETTTTDWRVSSGGDTDAVTSAPPQTVASRSPFTPYDERDDDAVRRDGAFYAFARFQQAQTRTHWPLLCFSGEAVMSNAAGISVMPLLNQGALREHARIVASDGKASSRTMVLGDGRTVRIDFEAIMQTSVTVGVLVRVHDIDTARERCQDSLPSLVGDSPPWRATVRDALNAVRAPRPTLLVGERGTGKTSLAQAAISWQLTEPGQAPIRILDCAVLAAQGSHQPLQDALDDGLSPLILTHIDALPEAWHVALLRALDILTTSGRHVWCTSNIGLKQLSDRVATDVFDHVVQLPPLRHRADDIPLIVEQTLQGYDAVGTRPIISPEAVQVLMRYRWPHNVAQLTALLRGAAAKVGRRSWIGVSDLPLYVQRDSARTRLTPYEAAEADVIRRALKVCEGNKSGAADLLGISRSTLYRKVRRYDLEFRRQS